MSKQIRMFIFSITIGIILHSQILSQGYPVYTLYSGSSWYYNPNVMYFGQSDGTPLGPNTKFRSLYTEINTYDTGIVVDSIYVSFLISNDVGTEPLTAYFTDFEDDNGSSQEIWDNIANGVMFDSMTVGSNDYFYERIFPSGTVFVSHFLSDVIDGEFEYSFYSPEAEALGNAGNRSYYIVNNNINVYPFGPNINQSTYVTFNNKNETMTNIQGTLEVDQTTIVPSGNNTYLTDGIQHTVRTSDQQIIYQTIEYQHHHWNTDLQEYFLEYSFDTRVIEQNALFDKLETISLQTNPTNTSLQIHDPWYYDETTQTQPDDFQPITSGQYQVFLDQGDPNNLQPPYYALKAPSVGQVTQNDIIVFDSWTVSPSNGATLNTNSATTTVVFHDVGSPVTITANYISALAAPGKIVTIPAGGRDFAPLNLISPTSL